jgi:hypothetical protein
MRERRDQDREGKKQGKARSSRERERERERESPNQFLELLLHIAGCGRFSREKRDLQREKTVLERVGV